MYIGLPLSLSKKMVDIETVVQIAETEGPSQEVLDELEYLKQLETHVTDQKCSQAQNILQELKYEFDTADRFYNLAGQFWENIENDDLDDIEAKYMDGMGISVDWKTCERCEELSKTSDYVKGILI